MHAVGLAPANANELLGHGGSLQRGGREGAGRSAREGRRESGNKTTYSELLIGGALLVDSPLGEVVGDGSVGGGVGGNERGEDRKGHESLLEKHGGV